MTMPKNMILGRHANTEGNEAAKKSRAGDHSLYTPAFKKRHSSTWRVTDKGLYQEVPPMSQWLQTEFPQGFERYYVSAYLRTKETAGALQLPGAQWKSEWNIRERDWGSLDSMDYEERKVRFAEEMAAKDTHGIFWTPPGGESMADFTTRLKQHLDTLHRECSEMNVLTICHGEVMWGIYLLLMRPKLPAYNSLDLSKDPRDKIHNCQLWHFTRVNPDDPSDIRQRYDWWRSICPWDTSLSRNTWQPIVRESYSNDELLAEVAQTPRMIAG